MNNAEDILFLLDKRVVKTNSKNNTPKPFKSGFKVNTVKSIIMHPILKIPAFTFVEDDSFVECRRVKLFKENTNVKTTTIPQDEWGVHRTHCCFDHGCKYSDSDCPVELGILKQDFKCESCN